MPAPTYDEFIDQYPAFAGVLESAVLRQLALSEKLLDKSAWGVFYGDAIGLDAAHCLSIRALAHDSGPSGGRQAAVGQITSSSAAGMSTSFSQMQVSAKNKSEEWYSKTSYGHEFLRLQDVVIPKGLVL